MTVTRDARTTPAAPPIELRSDTFTLPTAEMLAAIAAAPLGDECYREDPTVRALEQQVAALLRKEAACLMPSGTMANLAAVLSHAEGIAEPLVLLGDRSDLWIYEDRRVPEWAGIRFQPLATAADGSLSLPQIAGHLSSGGGPTSDGRDVGSGQRPDLDLDPDRDPDPDPDLAPKHNRDPDSDRAHDGARAREREREGEREPAAPRALVCLENPHNLCGGVVLSMDYLRDAAALVHAHGARLHLDGARLFNAAARLGIDAADIVRDADSVQFCLSKGLAAPIGSMVAGTEAFIARVRATRKRLGGDMHQAGVIAAAGLVAVTKMRGRLQIDHQLARRLAEGLAATPGIAIDLDTVQTNTVVFRLADADAAAGAGTCAGFLDALAAEGVRMSDFTRGRIRAVTHYGIDEDDIDRVIACVARILATGLRAGTAASEDLAARHG